MNIPSSIKTITYHGFTHGPRLLILGAVHGNEVCGTRAIERICTEIDAGSLRIERGSVSFVPITNPLAYILQQRSGDRNLNRNLRTTGVPQDFEDKIGNALCPLLDQHDVLLDLHSFHTGGEAFAMLGPNNNQGALEPFSLADKEEALATRLGPRRIVEGWLDTYARGVKNRTANASASQRANMLSTDPAYGVGTTEYMRSRGGYAITLECGQHTAPQAPEVAYQAIRNTLAHLGIAPLPAPQQRTDLEVLRICEVIDRHHPEDAFVSAWSGFDPLKEGELIGKRHDGSEVHAPRAGYILFPNPNALPGNEWFYFADLSERTVDGVTAAKR